MNIRLHRMIFGEYVIALISRIVESLQPKKVAGRGRRIDLQGLYWLECPDKVKVSDSCSILGIPMEDDIDSADYWLMKGETFTQQERLTEASHCFEQALKYDPKDTYALTYKGYCLYRLGHYETALACLQQADSRNPEINIIKALCLCHLRQFEEALGYFTSAPRHGLDSSALWNNKGFCLARLTRYREASAAFKIALFKCSEESLEILCNAASVMMELGTGNRALEYFSRALQIDAEDHVLLNNMAFCLEALGRFEQALKCYEKALFFDPGNSTYLFNQGICLLKQQHWDRAIACLQEVVRRDPGNSIAWCGLAAASLARGQAADALDCYNKALAPVG